MNTLKRIWNSMKGIEWDRVIVTLIWVVGFFVLMFAYFPVFTMILAYIVIGGILHNIDK